MIPHDLATAGWIGGAILALSVVGWTQLLRVWLEVRPARGQRDLIGGVREALRQGRPRDALALCDDRDTIVARLLRAALSQRLGRPADTRPDGGAAAEGSVVSPLAAEARRAHGALAPLDGIAATAPLLGLLGTVLGMSESFSALGAAGSGVGDDIAGGVSRALLTTQAGLTAALPLLVARAWLGGRVERWVVRARRVAARATPPGEARDPLTRQEVD